MSDATNDDIRPTAEDLARDLRADLATCDAATEGPWTVVLADIGDPLGRREALVCHKPGGGDYGRKGGRLGRFVLWSGDDGGNADGTFIATARTAHPAAIRRALAAEADRDRLAAENANLRRLLELLYSKWENGVPCQQVIGDESEGVALAGSVGNAFELDAEEEGEIIAALKDRKDGAA